MHTCTTPILPRFARLARNTHSAIERFILDGPPGDNLVVGALLLWPWCVVTLAYFILLAVTFPVIRLVAFLHTSGERIARCIHESWIMWRNPLYVVEPDGTVMRLGSAPYTPEVQP